MASAQSTANPLAPEWLEVPKDVNAIAGKVWPKNLTRDQNGEVTVGGVTVDELANTYGTPLYVIDEDGFKSNAAAVKQALETAAAKIGTTAKVYYASKAFLSTEIAAWINELGLSMDVASGGELSAAIAGGIAPERIGFHGNNKSLSEIGRAVSLGVGAIVIDSEIEIERIASTAQAQDKVQAVRLRVNTGVHANTHDFLATAREDQKFGIALADVPELVARIRSDRHLKFLGLHQHVGSQIFAPEGFIESSRRLIALHAQLLAGGPIPAINLGGGFGINYKPADNAPAVSKVAEAIVDAVAAECQKLGIAVPELAFEPGRAIAGSSGITLYNVGTIKDVTVTDGAVPAVRKYVSVDGGMSDNARPALYEAEYHTILASRVSSQPAVLARVVGKHCESGDIVVRHEYLPADVSANDLIAVAATGAYCYSLSSNYNWLPKPPVVAVGNGASRVILRGETEADLFALDARYQASVTTKNAKG